MVFKSKIRVVQVRFLFRRDLLLFWILLIVFVFRLKHLPLALSKSSKEEKLDKTETITSITSFNTQEIYAQVHILESISSFLPDEDFNMVNSYPTIFISDVIRTNLNIQPNSKIRLDLVKKSVPCTVTEVNYSCPNEKLPPEEIKSFYNSYTQMHDTVIINNYCAHTIDGQVLYFSFNPLNVPYVEMCYNDIQSCNFIFVERKIENNVGDVGESPFGLNLLHFRYDNLMKKFAYWF